MHNFILSMGGRCTSSLGPLGTPIVPCLKTVMQNSVGVGKNAGT